MLYSNFENQYLTYILVLNHCRAEITHNYIILNSSQESTSHLDFSKRFRVFLIIENEHLLSQDFSSGYIPISTAALYNSLSSNLKMLLILKSRATPPKPNSDKN